MTANEALEAVLTNLLLVGISHLARRRRSVAFIPAPAAAIVKVATKSGRSIASA